MTIEEVLVDAAAAVKSARDVLEQKELALRDILPPCFVLHDPYSVSSEDASDLICTAKDFLDDAGEVLDGLIKAANARSLSRDKDEEAK